MSMFQTPSQYSLSHTAMSQAREQEFPTLLFSLTPQHAEMPGPGTPRSVTRGLSHTSHTGGGATPNSVHTETTPPPPPPPVVRLTDDVVMEDPSTSAPRPSRPSISPYHHPQLLSPSRQQPATTFGDGPSQVMQFEPSLQYEDVWVTVYGFTQAEVPLILKEFSKCGDILQWGTYGQPQSNFLHIQFQNKYASHRALLRNGEHLTNSLILGVKPLDPRHRAAIEGYDAMQGSPGQVVRPRAAPERPYRVEFGSHAQQQIPQPSRNLFSKVAQYVFGM